MYRSRDTHSLWYAFKQLEASSSIESLVEVALDIDAQLDEEDEEGTDEDTDEDTDDEKNKGGRNNEEFGTFFCQSIDSLLSINRFPSLSRVELSRNIPFPYFPSLRSRRLLNFVPQIQMLEKPSERYVGKCIDYLHISY